LLLSLSIPLATLVAAADQPQDPAHKCVLFAAAAAAVDTTMERAIESGR